MKGTLVIIIGPSASGKTTLVQELLKRVPESARLVTVTTRSMRPQEKEGVDFFFISRKEFEQRIQEGDFFEHAEVYGNLYGSSKKILDSYLKQYRYVFAIIDVQGAETLRTQVKNTFSIFI